MKKLNKILTLLMLVTFLAGCIKSKEKEYLAPLSDEIVEPNSFAELSGEELFKGIFFLNGDLSKHIDCLSPAKEQYSQFLNSLPDKNEAAIRTALLEDSLIRNIKAQNPSFFVFFKANISSGDPIKARNSLLLASSLLSKTMSSDPGLRPYLLAVKEVTDKMDVAEFSDSKGEINHEKLKTTMNKMLNSDLMTNSNETLSNFGMSSGSGQIALCTISVAYYAYAISVVGVMNVGAVVNIAGAVNLAAAVNGFTWLNVKNYSSSGNPCAGCHAGAISMRLEEEQALSSSKIPVSNAKACNRYSVVFNTSSEIFVAQLTRMLEKTQPKR